MTVQRSDLINLLNKMNSNVQWEDTNQIEQWLNGQLVSEPLTASYKEVNLFRAQLRQALGPDVKVKVKRDDKGRYQIVVETQSLNAELNLRKNKVDALKMAVEQKKEGLEARIPPILSRGGKAEGFLKRDAFMLTQHQVNFVRKMQLEQVFNKKGKSIATNILLSHEKYPDVFAKNDPTVLIGAQGEAIMLCKQEPLGEGGLGSVYIGQQLDTGDFCVVKSLHVVNDESAFEFEKENKTLEELNLLIETMQVVDDGAEKLYSVQDLAWGKDYCKFLGIETGQQQNVSVIKRLDIFIKALEKIHEMHTKDAKLHRDIKVENIVWDEQTQTAKLVDVGFTENMKSGKYQDDKLVGTAAYMAPELIMNNFFGDPLFYNVQSEIYAAGMLGCEIFSANNLAIDKEDVVSNLVDQKKNKFFVDGLSHSLSQADIFQDDPNRSEATSDLFLLIKFMVDINEENRPDFDAAIYHLKEIQKNLVLELGNLNQQPAKRGEAKEPLTNRYIEQLDEKLRNRLMNRQPDKTPKDAQSESIKEKLMLLAKHCDDATKTEPNASIEKLKTEIRKMALQDLVTLSDLKKLTQDCITASTSEKLKQLTSRSRGKGNNSPSLNFLDSILTEVNSILKSTPEYQAGLKNTLLQRKRAQKSPPEAFLQEPARPRADANAPPPLPPLPPQNMDIDATRPRAKGHNPPPKEKGLMQKNFIAKIQKENKINTISPKEENKINTISPKEKNQKPTPPQSNKMD